MKIRAAVFIFGFILMVLGAVVVIVGLLTYYWIAGLITMAIGGIMMRKADNKDTKVFHGEIERLKNDLKKNGEAVRVEFVKCEIKTNDYSQERETESYGSGGGNSHFFDALYDERRNAKVVEVYQSVIVFNYEHDGITETFYSEIIPKEKTYLLFILDTKKETMLYIDKDNRESYFFDLDFLGKHLI